MARISISDTPSVLSKGWWEKRLVCYLASAVLATLFFFYLYPSPLEFLAGKGVYFETGDTPQHVTGWLLYAKDAWRWPPLVTQMMDAPTGINIALTDSIPLAALLFKPFYPFFPENFHYFGIWHLLNKITQATGAVFLIRSLGRRDLLAAIVAAMFALMLPASLFRIGHTALAGHGLLLIALGFYFRTTADGPTPIFCTVSFGVLSVIGLLIHPYLFAMVFPIALAAATDRWRDGAPLVLSLLIVTGSAAMVIAAIWLFGYSASSSSEVEGYSYYSMNLLAPFCGGLLSPCGLQDGTNGQYEGFNYFGGGTFLLLILAAMMASYRAVWTWSAKHLALVALFAGFTIYAISNRVFIGAVELLAFPMPWPAVLLTSIFRASGRFFWIVSYAITFLALLRVLNWSTPLSLMCIAAALILQWIDTSPLRDQTRALLQSTVPFNYSGWMDISSKIDKIIVSPLYGCDPAIGNMKYLYFQIVASRLGVPINTGYVARNKNICSDEIEAKHLQLNVGILYVYLNPTNNLLRLNEFPGQHRLGECIEWRDWHGPLLCLDGATVKDWEHIGIR